MNRIETGLIWDSTYTRTMADEDLAAFLDVIATSPRLAALSAPERRALIAEAARRLRGNQTAVPVRGGDERKLEAGDHIVHIASGEEWVVLAVQQPGIPALVSLPGRHDRSAANLADANWKVFGPDPSYRLLARCDYAAR